MSSGFSIVGRVAIILAVLIAAAWALGAYAQGRIDPERGEAVARTWCVNCHVIAEDQTEAVSGDAPPFSALTLEEGYSDERLRGFLSRPHGAMEGFDPDKRQIEDLIAYIRTQAP